MWAERERYESARDLIMQHLNASIMSLIVKCIKPLGQTVGLLIGFCAASGEKPYAFSVQELLSTCQHRSFASQPSGDGSWAFMEASGVNECLPAAARFLCLAGGGYLGHQWASLV